MLPIYYPRRMGFDIANSSGTTVHATDSVMSRFFQRYLWQTLIGVLKWTIPDTWSYDYFTSALYMGGRVCIFKTDRFGIIPQYFNPWGQNVFYEPTHCAIANPLINTVNMPVIDVNCAVIRVNPDWEGMEDLITFYADLMAAICSAVSVNIINSKLAYILLSKNKNMKDSMSKMYDDIASGKPAVFIDRELLSRDGTPNWILFDQNVQSHYITDKLLVDLQNILNMFYTEIGIPNTNQEKRERLISDEVNANNVATSIGTISRLERMQRGVKSTKKLFPELDNFGVDWTVPPNLTEGDSDDKPTSKSDSNTTRKS